MCFRLCWVLFGVFFVVKLAIWNETKDCQSLPLARSMMTLALPPSLSLSLLLFPPLLLLLLLLVDAVWGPAPLGLALYLVSSIKVGRQAPGISGLSWTRFYIHTYIALLSLSNGILPTTSKTMRDVVCCLCRFLFSASFFSNCDCSAARYNLCTDDNDDDKARPNPRKKRKRKRNRQHLSREKKYGKGLPFYRDRSLNFFSFLPNAEWNQLYTAGKDARHVKFD